MRFTSILKRLLGVTQLYVRGIAMDRDLSRSHRRGENHDVLAVGTRAAQYPSVGRWQDLNWGPIRIYLVYRCRRVTCARCGGRPRNELVPWAAAGTKFTHRMEELAAVLARQTDITSVTSLLGMAEPSADRPVWERRVSTQIGGRACIGVDEFSYRKRLT